MVSVSVLSRRRSSVAPAGVLIVLLALLAVAAVGPAPAAAQQAVTACTKTFVPRSPDADGRSWQNGANWRSAGGTTGTVPGASDIACVNGPTSTTVNFRGAAGSTTTVRAVRGAGGVLNVLSGTLVAGSAGETEASSFGACPEADTTCRDTTNDVIGENDRPIDSQGNAARCSEPRGATAHRLTIARGATLDVRGPSATWLGRPQQGSRGQATCLLGTLRNAGSMVVRGTATGNTLGEPLNVADGSVVNTGAVRIQDAARFVRLGSEGDQTQRGTGPTWTNSGQGSRVELVGPGPRGLGTPQAVPDQQQTGSVVNEGTILADTTRGSGSSVFRPFTAAVDVPLSNTGRVEVTSGRLVLSDLAQLDNGFTTPGQAPAPSALTGGRYVVGQSGQTVGTAEAFDTPALVLAGDRRAEPTGPIGAIRGGAEVALRGDGLLQVSDGVTEDAANAHQLPDYSLGHVFETNARQPSWALAAVGAGSTLEAERCAARGGGYPDAGLRVPAGLELRGTLRLGGGGMQGACSLQTGAAGPDAPGSVTVPTGANATLTTSTGGGLSARGAVSGALTVNASGIGGLTASGPIVTSGATTLSGGAELQSDADVALSGALTTDGATVDADRDLTLSGIVTETGGSVVSADRDVSASAAVTLNGTAALRAARDMTTSGTVATGTGTAVGATSSLSVEGELRGSGTITSPSTTVSGTLRAGVPTATGGAADYGPLRLSGNLTLGGGSTLAARLDGPTPTDGTAPAAGAPGRYAVVRVGGTTQLGGTLAIDAQPGVQVPTGTRLRFIQNVATSPQTASGTFARLTGGDLGRRRLEQAKDTQGSGADVLQNAGPGADVTSPATGSSTTDTTPTYAGTASTGPSVQRAITVEVYRGRQAVASPTASDRVQTLTAQRAAAGEAWSVEPTAALPDGVYTVIATQRDVSEPANPLSGSGGSVFRVDSSTPAPTSTEPAAGARVASTTPVLRGTGGVAGRGAAVEDDLRTVEVAVRPTGADCASTAAPVRTFAPEVSDAGAWTVPASAWAGATLADGGSYVLCVAQDDRAGHRGRAAAAPFVVDVTAPALSVTSPTDGQRVTASSANVSGGAGAAAGDEARVHVDVLDARGAVATAFDVPVSGAAWSSITGALPNGSYALEASQRDAAGNVARVRRGFTIAAPTASAGAPTPVPEAPSADCPEVERRIGHAIVRGCFQGTGRLTVAASPVTLNGLTITPTGRGGERRVVTLTDDPDEDAVVLEAKGAEVRAGQTTFTGSGVRWRLPRNPAATQTILDARLYTRGASGTDEPPAAAARAFRGMTLADAGAKVTLDRSGDALVDTDIVIPGLERFVQFGTATATAQLRTRDRVGLVGDDVEARAGVITWGVYELAGVSIRYSARTDVWTGRAKLRVPIAKKLGASKNGLSPSVETAISFTGDGRFRSARAVLDSLSIPIGPVFLQKTSFGLGIDPFSVSGGVGLSAGPKIPVIAGDGIISGDGEATFTSGVSPAVDVKGNLRLVSIPVGNASVRVDDTGARFAGTLGLGLPNPNVDPATQPFAVYGKLAGGVGESWFSLEAQARVVLLDTTIADAQVIGSTVGIAACGQIGPVRGGAGYTWQGQVTIMGTGCDIGPYRPTQLSGRAVAVTSRGLQTAPVAPAEQVASPRQAVTSERTLELPEGDSVLRLTGATDVPDVDLIGPNGRRVSTPAAGSSSVTGRQAVLRHDEERQLFVALGGARGTWRVVPRAGSSAITGIDGAREVASPDVSARISGASKTGARTVSWSANARPGQRIEFYERRSGVDRRIARAAGSSGSFRFRPAPGPGGTRRIEAVVLQDGLARDSEVVGRFVAPRRARPDRVSGVRVARAKGGLRVSWSGSESASLWSVAVDPRNRVEAATTVDGDRRSVFVPLDADATGAKVTVAAKGFGTRFGTPRTVRVPARPSVRTTPSGAFTGDSAVLRPVGRRWVARLAADAGARARSISCRGYAARVRGYRPAAQALGLRRAKVVCAAVRRAGLAGPQRVSSGAYTPPRGTNATKRGRALNRRVQVRLRY